MAGEDKQRSHDVFPTESTICRRLQICNDHHHLTISAGADNGVKRPIDLTSDKHTCNIREHGCVLKELGKKTFRSGNIYISHDCSHCKNTLNISEKFLLTLKLSVSLKNNSFSATGSLNHTITRKCELTGESIFEIVYKQLTSRLISSHPVFI